MTCDTPAVAGGRLAARTTHRWGFFSSVKETHIFVLLIENFVN